jgi:signal transduction histidine kinase
MRQLADIRRQWAGKWHSVRYRLLVIALLPMLVILPVMLGISIYRWNAKFDAALISRVNDDLTIAHQYLARILENVQEQLVAVTQSASFRDLLLRADSSTGDLDTFLTDTERSHHLDFLYIIDEHGRIVASAQPLTASSVRSDWPIIRAALAGRSQTSIDVFDQADLLALSPDLARRARIELVPTADATKTTRTEEQRGMVIHSADAFTLPVEQHAALVGGILLNQNLGFIDTINDLVFHINGRSGNEAGTATLFLGDVRISTNVRLFKDRRAIGTRVSAPVESAVLEQGHTWLDKAFVVNAWYMSAYQPILDSYDRRVGMLYVGFLERPYAQAKRATVLEIAAAFVVAVIATVPLFLRWAADIFRPLEGMTQTIAQVESGDLGARTGNVGSTDEIGRVAHHFNQLLDRIQERDERMRQWNDELNQRVEERALKLQHANQQLEATTKQLIMSEKLATIGEITAGVAHEINNPIAVMQGNLEVIRELMGSGVDVAKTEFQLIDEQLRRIGEIVTRLLQFAKPQEYAGYSEQYDVADVVTHTLPLVRHLLNKSSITVEREYRASRLIQMNRTELQQVLVNLLVNAIHAMPMGGRLKLRTFDRDESGRSGVVIEVADTGAGMLPEVMARIFDPFFTTKGREGTGLGLSICQMLLARQGGRISVESEPQHGTTFTVWLPQAG